MTQENLHQTVDLIAVNIQEILEILPTLATKDQVNNLATTVNDLDKKVRELIMSTLEGFRIQFEVSQAAVKVFEGYSTRLDQIEAILRER